MIERFAMLDQIAAEHSRPVLFVTVSGAHLYGFPSPDSDFDLRGVHLKNPDEFLGFSSPSETIEQAGVREDLEIDLVTHDARKFFRLMLKRNGYVLEQLFSPLVIRTGPEHRELVELGHGCITRHHAEHYVGFARNQWRLLHSESPPRVKPLLYVYRVLLTGIHLMRTGRVEANLIHLNEIFGLAQIPDLIAAKIGGGEHDRLTDADIGFHEREYERLLAELQAAGASSTLPEAPSARRGLEDLLLRLRLRAVEEAVR